ncbi:MAG TPA: polyketide synthase dehydratase domain-containing protein, partial [Spirochaetota bacterium]|nr:polyketide synthase dehydratase domain-containing protein [Spirochaetota bacterium]
MEGIPEITGAVRSHLKIRVRSYMMDHRSLAGVILPAVEIMEILADSVLSACPGVDVLSISDARFDRFIPLEQGRDELECFADIEYMADGCVRVKLLTRAALKGGITRTKEHASMVFGRPFQGDSYPADMACCVEGVAFEVQAADLYRELVPFGPSYRNLAGVLYLTKEGALGAVSGGNIHGESWPLGSPFPLDAAF